jgi:hypothetical protein
MMAGLRISRRMRKSLVDRTLRKFFDLINRETGY